MHLFCFKIRCSHSQVIRSLIVIKCTLLFIYINYRVWTCQRSIEIFHANCVISFDGPIVDSICSHDVENQQYPTILQRSCVLFAPRGVWCWAKQEPSIESSKQLTKLVDLNSTGGQNSIENETKCVSIYFNSINWKWQVDVKKKTFLKRRKRKSLASGPIFNA